MIEAKDLRIGNLVLIKGQICRIEAITGESVSVTGYEGQRYTPFKLKQIEPIKLTEEWLLKMGFDEWSEGHYKIRKSLCKNGWSEKFNYYLPYFNLSTYTGNCSIKHVHQLQNLYYCLTGEELLIN